MASKTTQSASKPKKPPTDGTILNPHKLSNNDWLTEAVSEHFVDGGKEGVHVTYIVSFKDPDYPRAWNWVSQFATPEKAVKFVTDQIKRHRKTSVEDQRRRWERDNFIGQTRQIVQFTLDKKTSKKKLAEYAAMMEEHVARFKGKPSPKMPKFVPLEEDIPEYKIEKIYVTLTKEIVNYGAAVGPQV